MITFEKISKKFKNNFWEKEHYALSDVSFSIHKGDLVGFLGANGAGKTTLIKCLMDFSKQTSGEIIFDSSLGNTNVLIRSKIGYLPERAYLYQHLTGREFLTYTGKLNGLNNELLKARIEKWTERLTISHALDRQIKGYSKGMQQRLGFVSAIFHEPDFLVLDEPLSGLDPMGRKDFKSILSELNKQGVTIFFSSHIVADVEQICNKVVFIEKGKLIYEGSIDELIHKNSNDYYTISYMENDKLAVVKIRETEKNQYLSDLIKANINIIEVEKDKLTLEEIIYKIKQ